MPLSRINSASIDNSAISAADIADGTITAAKIISVANTQITGNIVSSQIAPDQTLNGNVSVTGTGALTLPVGTTAERPTPVTGMTRFNSTLGYPEWYNSAASAWVPYSSPATYSIDYLVVAGGGGGNSSNGGGGGAGGYLAATATANTNGVYAVTVGTGGPTNTAGVNSSLGALAIAIGGGYGGARSTRPGGNGGSGGGGGADVAPNNVPGSGTSGQGYAGATGNEAPNYQGGGGGGASAAATNVNGTAGLNWQSLGTFYAGGGGGGANAVAGSGGTGGGGAGSTTGTAGSGTANTGGGGGSAGSGGTGGAGGSGIVIIRYQSATQIGSGGTVTSSGGYYYHTFTTSGTYTA